MPMPMFNPMFNFAIPVQYKVWQLEKTEEVNRLIDARIENLKKKIQPDEALKTSLKKYIKEHGKVKEGKTGIDQQEFLEQVKLELKKILEEEKATLLEALKLEIGKAIEEKDTITNVSQSVAVNIHKRHPMDRSGEVESLYQDSSCEQFGSYVVGIAGCEEVWFSFDVRTHCKFSPLPEQGNEDMAKKIGAAIKILGNNVNAISGEVEELPDKQSTLKRMLIREKESQNYYPVPEQWCAKVSVKAETSELLVIVYPTASKEFQSRVEKMFFRTKEERIVEICENYVDDYYNKKVSALIDKTANNLLEILGVTATPSALYAARHGLVGSTHAPAAPAAAANGGAPLKKDDDAFVIRDFRPVDYYDTSEAKAILLKPKRAEKIDENVVIEENMVPFCLGQPRAEKATELHKLLSKKSVSGNRLKLKTELSKFDRKLLEEELRGCIELAEQMEKRMKNKDAHVNQEDLKTALFNLKSLYSINSLLEEKNLPNILLPPRPLLDFPGFCLTKLIAVDDILEEIESGEIQPADAEIKKNYFMIHHAKNEGFLGKLYAELRLLSQEKQMSEKLLASISPPVEVNKIHKLLSNKDLGDAELKEKLLELLESNKDLLTRASDSYRQLAKQAMSNANVNQEVLKTAFCALKSSYLIRSVTEGPKSDYALFSGYSPSVKLQALNEILKEIELLASGAAQPAAAGALTPNSEKINAAKHEGLLGELYAKLKSLPEFQPPSSRGHGRPS